MRSLKKTVVKGKDGVYVRGEVWSNARYRKDMDRRNQYNRETYKQIQVRLRRETTPDLLNWITLIPNFNEYIRDLMRADLQRRMDAGEIELDMQTGEIKVLKQPEDIELTGDSCSDWNREEPLPEGSTLWNIELPKGRKKKEK